MPVCRPAVEGPDLDDEGGVSKMSSRQFRVWVTRPLAPILRRSRPIWGFTATSKWTPPAHTSAVSVPFWCTSVITAG